MPRQRSPLDKDLDPLVEDTIEKVLSTGEPPDALPIPIRPAEAVQLERECALLDRALVETLRDGSKDFWFFLTQVLFPDVWKSHYVPDFHRPLCHELMALKPGEELALFLPRQSRKSFIFTIAHSIWRIVHDPDIRILLVGAREDTVKPFARTILQAFLPDTPGYETFRKVFPEFTITHRQYKHILQALQFTHPRRKLVLPDPTFRATYLGVTGAGWRADLIIFDDAVERRNVTTPEQSAKTMRQMLDLLPLVDMGSRYRNIIYLGTRWAYHDPYGRLIGDQDEATDEADELVSELADRDIKVIVRHALEDPNRPCEACPEHVVRQFPHGHPDFDRGEPILLPVVTREWLAQELARYRRDRNLGEALWWHQYMNVCLSPDQQRFREEWFAVAGWADWPSPRKRVIAIDSASKDFQTAGRGDYMVALFGSFTDDGRLLLRHGLRSNRWTRDEFVRRIVTACVSLDWWPNVLVKEKVGEDAFLADLGRAFREKYRTPALVPVTRARSGRKEDFIVEALQAPCERGEVVFGSGFPPRLRERLLYELTNLGQITHDDVADTLALFFVPGVRVLQPKKPIERGPELRPPSLSLYSLPGQPRPPAPPPPDLARARALGSSAWGSPITIPLARQSQEVIHPLGEFSGRDVPRIVFRDPDPRAR